MPQNDIAIQTKGLTKDYGSRRAVNDLNDFAPPRDLWLWLCELYLEKRERKKD